MPEYKIRSFFIFPVRYPICADPDRILCYEMISPKVVRTLRIQPAMYILPQLLTKAKLFVNIFFIYFFCFFSFHYAFTVPVMKL